MLIGCVSCCSSYSIVSYLYVSFSGLITSVGEERAIFFCYRLLVGFVTWDRLLFIVANLGPSI